MIDTDKYEKIPTTNEEYLKIWGKKLTDEHEGHTEGPWVMPDPGYGLDEGWLSEDAAKELGPHCLVEAFRYDEHLKGWYSCEGIGLAWTVENARLMADAPLLLAEVKRLRKGVKTLYEYLDAVITYEDEEILLGIKGALKVMIE